MGVGLADLRKCTGSGQIVANPEVGPRRRELLLEEPRSVSPRVWDACLQNRGCETGISETGASTRACQFHHPPVHCSWMNQVEQWFGILQRKRFGIINFADKKELAERLDAFVKEWNSHAHAFRWSRKSFDKVLADREKNMAAAA